MRPSIDQILTRQQEESPIKNQKFSQRSNHEGSANDQKDNDGQNRFASAHSEAKKSENNRLEPSVLEIKLQRLLAESAERERQYIEFIKQQKEQIFNVTSQYSETMDRHKKELMGFIKAHSLSQKNKQKYEDLHRLQAKAPPNQYNKLQFTYQQNEKGIGFENSVLTCNIKFLYLTFFVEDYICERVPNKMTILLKQYYPEQKNFSLDFVIDPRISDEQIQDCLKNAYPIQIYTKELISPQYKFQIGATMLKTGQFSEDSLRSLGKKTLKYYKEQQLQFFIIEPQSQIEYCAGKVDLQQLLYYSGEGEQRKEQWVQKIPLYGIQNSSQIRGHMHVELSNMCYVDKNSHKHRNNIKMSLEPMTVQIGGNTYIQSGDSGNVKMDIKTNPNDKQSRIINRINTYKNTHTNVLLKPPSEVNSNDRNILMHKKRRQLQKIQQYKQNTKQQYMSKLFNQAIELYHTEKYQLGECKYVFFRYANTTGRHQRVQFQCKNVDTQSNKNSQINIDRIDPAHVNRLIQMGIIILPDLDPNSIIDYEIDGQGYSMIVSGETIIVFFKIIIHPSAFMPDSSNRCKYQVKFYVENQYTEQLFDDSLFVKITPPTPIHSFTLRTYVGQVSQLRVEVPGLDQYYNMGKSKIAHILHTSQNPNIRVDHSWNSDYEILQIRIHCINSSNSFGGKIGRTVFVIVYDINYTTTLALYEIQIHSYPLLAITNAPKDSSKSIQSQKNVQTIQDNCNIDTGVPFSFKFNFKLPMSEGDNKKLIKFITSDITNKKCKINPIINGSHRPQLLASPNVQYPVQIAYLSFHDQPKIDKILIHAVEVMPTKGDHKKGIFHGRWMLKIHRNPIEYKHIYKLNCPSEENYVYNNFELYNSSTQQVNYRVKSSNYSLLSVEGTGNYMLFGGQAVKVPLNITYWNNQEEPDDGGVRNVVMSVDVGKGAPLLYLFEIKVQN